MSWINNLSIRAKVIGAFLLVGIATTALGIFSVQRLSTIDNHAQIVGARYLPAEVTMANIIEFTSKVRIRQGSSMQASDEASRKKERETLNAAIAQVETLKQQYAKFVDAQEQPLFDKWVSGWNEYISMNNELANKIAANDMAGATQYFLYAMRNSYRDNFMVALHADMDYNVKAATAEAKAGTDAFETAQYWIYGTIALTALICFFSAYIYVTGVSAPIGKIVVAMQRLAKHDMKITVEGMERRDEVGRMASSLQVFLDSMLEADRLKAEQETEHARAKERAQKVAELTSAFDIKVAGVVQAVSSQANQMQSSAQAMSATAEETTKQANAVAAASEQGAANVQTVASATEELASSISEIGRQVSHSSEIAGNAVMEASKANDMVQGLVSASQKIGEIVKLINEIADQTNLLALNATIEAARAGEAGKGFAVVAAEVKNLATQTSKATEEIGAQITSVQGATQNAVAAIGSIGKIIGEIDKISTAIAAAVEEQGAATQEIARNVEETAKGTREISSNISGVTQAANGTGAAANQVLVASRALTEQSGALKEVVQSFLNNVKAA